MIPMFVIYFSKAYSLLTLNFWNKFKTTIETKYRRWKTI